MQKDSIEEKEKENENESGGMSFSGSDIFGILFVVAAVGGIYLGFYKWKM
jgi:cobaltochelatase CobN